MTQPYFSLEYGRYINPNAQTFVPSVRKPGDPFDPDAVPSQNSRFMPVEPGPVQVGDVIGEEPYMGPAYGGTGTAAPRGTFAIPIDPKTGQRIPEGTSQYGSLQPENVSENYDKDGKYRGPMPGGGPGAPTVSQRDNEQGGDRGYVNSEVAILRDMLDKYNDPDLLRRKLEATEPYFLRVAERNQKMGLENLEAAGKAAFNYKYAPQMFMTAAASKAAYYPEMVRAASDSYTGLNLANAAKPRMSGYYRGLM